MRKGLLFAIILFLLVSLPGVSQSGIIYLPLIIKGEIVAPEPILRVITQDGKIVDLLADWEISDPYWRPQIAKYKGDGNYVDSAIADGSRLVSKKYANAIETIPLTVRGTNQAQAINRIRELLQVIRQAADYWTEPYEYDYAWLEVRPACNDCRTGYAKIVKANIPELNNPYGQPFFSAQSEAVMDELSLIIEREPLWRGVQPGTIIGPLYNLAKNPDFELWNFGVTDSQPDSWNDLESIGITGINSREDDNHSGEYSLKVRVSQSTSANRFKGVSQVIADTKPNTQYTAIAWVRNDGVSNGVGRILVTYLSQLELYRSNSKHGWQLYTGTFTTGDNDTVAINLEILTTAANTDGTVYFDSLMILEGDWQQEAIENMLPYMTSSHIVNHWDQPENAKVEAGDINYVDMWNVPGDESALVRLEVQNNTTPAEFSAPVELFATVRVGMRRTNNVVNFQNYQDFLGITDTTASSDDRLETTNLNNSWLEAGIKVIEGVGNVRDNQGRFRIFARIYDPKSSGDPTLESRLNYFVGTAGINVKALDSVIAPIRANWTIVGLTPNAAMIWDRKFSANPLTQVGYSVQMSRATGTDKGRLDYVLAMPTDGGYIEARINPPLKESDALVVDNTGPALTVEAVQKAQQWVKIYSVSETVSFIFTDGTFLYISEDRAALNTRIHKLKPGQSASVFTLTASYATPTNPILSFEIFNGKMFLSNADKVYEVDSITFAPTERVDVAAGAGLAFFLKSFSARLFITASKITPLPLETTVWTWDGTAAVQSATFAEDSIGQPEIYAGRLFVPTQGGLVREYNPDTNTWTLHTVNGASVTVGELEPFNGKLLMSLIVGANVLIYSYDGSSWTQVASIVSGGLNLSLLAFDNLLYAQAGGDTYISSDGVTFSLLTTFTPTLMTTFDGLLVGYSGSDIYILSPEDTPDKTYAIGDFRGTPFIAPPRTRTDERRHRYVFSYDRQNFINNLDDKALIGIGIVPLYLALIGDETP